MPPGTPFNAFTPPYRIRIDEFTTLPPDAPQPLLHLLTHAHSDHTLGLAAKSFGYPVICSADTKEMLLRHEVYKERELLENGVRTEKVRTYGHLKVGLGEGEEEGGGVKRDLLRTIPIMQPMRIRLNKEEEVVVVAFDANHCPGAVMYLIEGPRGAILHTGDIRIEPWFLDSLKRNPYLQPYLYPDAAASTQTISKILEAIYLDTASVFTTFSVPTKEEATDGLIELMRMYPPDTHFFLNCWTWGYEDVMKGVARGFQSMIHVDRYKHTILSRLSDPFLRSIITRDGTSIRFHACERFGRCDAVDVDCGSFDKDSRVPNLNKTGHNTSKAGYRTTSKTGARVVYVNPVTMGSASWKLYLKETRGVLESGKEAVNSLLVPLSRHSPLPELQSLVSLFRPKRIVPNTLDPGLMGLDWAAIDRVF
ncbi:beta-lactamase-like protein [Cyathus striatus]|nr:beta-lactamase-like protein [Cyathus striatus]